MARREDSGRDRGADLDELEEAIEHLKVVYDRYFNGVDNVPPVRKHEAVTRLVREFMRRPPMRTVQKFRYQTLKGRFNTYEQYWNRIMRQIEQGTYKRLLSEARRREEVMRARRAEHRRSEAKKAAEGGAAARPRPRTPPPRARRCACARGRQAARLRARSSHRRRPLQSLARHAPRRVLRPPAVWSRRPVSARTGLATSAAPREGLRRARPCPVRPRTQAVA